MRGGARGWKFTARIPLAFNCDSLPRGHVAVAPLWIHRVGLIAFRAHRGEPAYIRRCVFQRRLERGGTGEKMKRNDVAAESEPEAAAEDEGKGKLYKKRFRMWGILILINSRRRDNQFSSGLGLMHSCVRWEAIRDCYGNRALPLPLAPLALALHVDLTATRVYFILTLDWVIGSLALDKRWRKNNFSNLRLFSLLPLLFSWF